MADIVTIVELAVLIVRSPVQLRILLFVWGVLYLISLLTVLEDAPILMSATMRIDFTMIR